MSKFINICDFDASRLQFKALEPNSFGERLRVSYTYDDGTTGQLAFKIEPRFAKLKREFVMKDTPNSPDVLKGFCLFVPLQQDGGPTPYETAVMDALQRMIEATKTYIMDTNGGNWGGRQKKKYFDREHSFVNFSNRFIKISDDKNGQKQSPILRPCLRGQFEKDVTKTDSTFNCTSNLFTVDAFPPQTPPKRTDFKELIDVGSEVEMILVYDSVFMGANSAMCIHVRDAGFKPRDGNSADSLLYPSSMMAGRMTPVAAIPASPVSSAIPVAAEEEEEDGDEGSLGLSEEDFEYTAPAPVPVVPAAAAVKRPAPVAPVAVKKVKK